MRRQANVDVRKRLRYIGEEDLPDKRLQIYYLNKRLIFRFNNMSVTVGETLMGKHLLISAVVSVENKVIIEELVKNL